MSLSEPIERLEGRRPRRIASTDRNRPLRNAPDRKLASRRINEMEAAAAGKAEDRLCNHSAGLADGIEGRFEVIHAYDRQWSRQRVGRVALKAQIRDSIIRC